MRYTLNVLNSFYIVLPFIFFSSGNLIAQAVDEQIRPSLSVFNLVVDDNERLLFEEFDVSSTTIPNAAFIDLSGVINLSGSEEISLESLYSSGGSTANPQYDLEYVAEKLKEYFKQNDFAQQIITHQFQISEDFIWSNDLLYERGQYSQTLKEAEVDISSERGAISSSRSEFLNSLTRSYILITLTPARVFEKQIPLLDETITQYLADTYAFMFKLDYDTPEDVIKDLNRFYCSESDLDCSNKKEAFYEFEVPIKLLSTNSSGVKGIRTGSSFSDPVLLSTVAKYAFDMSVTNIPSLQLRTYVESRKPITARVGMKEGVQKGRRYEVVRLRLNAKEEVVTEKRGFVRAKEVVDNRSNVTQIDPETGKEVLAQFKPSSFVQVHGLRIDQRDVLVEAYDIGLLVKPYAGFGSYTSGGVDVLYRIPNTVGGYFGLTGDVSVTNEEDVGMFFADLTGFGTTDIYTTMLQGGLLFGADTYPVNGNIRIMPQAAFIVNYGMFASENEATKEVIDEFKPYILNFGLKLKMDLSIQVKQNFGIVGGVTYTYLTDDFTYNDDGEDVEQELIYSDYFSNTGVQLTVGFRVSF
tara:strand:- start:66218 stop:67963 length:1746 start_codon:yes stop_codon:yes gene_type:complete